MPSNCGAGEDFFESLGQHRTSLVAQTVKHLPTMWETWVQSLGWENLLEKERQPTPVFLPEKSHGWKSLVGYSSRGLQRIRHNWATSLSLLDSLKIKLVNPKGKQPWILIGKTDAEAEASILWPSDVKNWLIGKDPDAGKEWKQGKIESTEMNKPQILRIKALFLVPLVSSLPVFNPSASWVVSTSKI